METATKFLLLVVLLQWLVVAENPSGSGGSNFGDGSGDIGVSLGSSAATKLVRGAIDHVLRKPQFIELDLNSAKDPWFKEVARLDSRNRIAIGSLDVNFGNEHQIEVEGRDLHLNSTTQINNAALPLFFLDQKQVLIDVQVKRAFLRLQIDKPTALRVDECELEHGDVNMSLDRSYLFNLVLNTLKGTMPEKWARDQVCALLLETAIDVRQKYQFEWPFKQMIPEKFQRYLLNDGVRLRLRIQSISAANDQVTVTALMEWTEEPQELGPNHSLIHSVQFSELFSTDATTHQVGDGKGPVSAQQAEQTKNSPTNAQPSSDAAAKQQSAIKERLLVWMEDRLLNDLLKQFRWDFQWINESIQLNSPRLPKETRAFFEVICPQCYFLFNISADGMPQVEIKDKVIVVRNRNRIAAAVLNPTLGTSGEKRTAIDLSMQLVLKMVPQIQQGFFRTQLELLERKVEVKNGSAFPSNMYKLVEQLIQDLIAEDIWPALQRELEPLIFKSGIQLPQSCGLDPKSAELHFEQGRIGVSAQLDLEKLSLGQCPQQLKSGLPDASKLFTLPKQHVNP